MAEVSLQKCFLERKPVFYDTLDAITDQDYALFSQYVIEAIYNELSGLLDYNGKYRKSLNKSENAILASIIEIVFPQKDLLLNLSYKQANPSNVTCSNKKRLFGDGDLKWILAAISAVGGGFLKFSPVAQLTTAVIFFVTGVLIEKVAEPAISKNNTSGSNDRYILEESAKQAIVNTVITILSKIDSSIEVYRAQISNNQQALQSKIKPFEVEYETLLRKIGTLLGALANTKEKLNQDTEFEIRSLEKALNSLDLQVVHYSDNIPDSQKVNLFDAVTSSSVKNATAVYPAIKKNGTVVIKGRIDIPDNL